MSPRSTRLRSSLIGAGMVIALGLTGCSSSSKPAAGSDTPDRAATLRIGTVVASTLDPATAVEPGQALMATWPVYDRLLQLTEQGEYAPMLATSWEFSDGGQVLNLQLREGVTFSDGEAFDADVVKANIDRFRSGKSVASQLTATITEVKVVDKHKVALRLATPTTTVLNALATATGGAMISPKSLAGDDLGTHPVGTGAYVIDSFKPGVSVSYKRRTDAAGIWDDKTGVPARIELMTYGTDAGFSAIRSKQVDMVLGSNDTGSVQKEIDSGQLVTRRLPASLTMMSLYLNRSVKPFDDVRVRQAINFAIDRKSLVDAFGEGMSPRVQPYPKGIPGFDESLEKTYPYDPAKAKKLLAEAGHPNGLDVGEFLIGQNGTLPQTAQAIQAQLAEVGIKMQLKNRDILQLITDYSKTNAPGMLMYLSTPSVEPASWMARMHVNPIWIPAGVSEEMKPLVGGLDDPNLSDADRAAKAAAATKVAVEQAYYAPLWQGNTGYVMSPKVRGVDAGELPYGVFVPDFRYVYLSK